MSSRTNCTPSIAVLFASVLLGTAACAEEAFVREDLGFSVVPPRGWMSIPGADLSKDLSQQGATGMAGSARRGAAETTRLLASFQAKSNDMGTFPKLKVFFTQGQSVRQVDRAKLQGYWNENGLPVELERMEQSKIDNMPAVRATGKRKDVCICGSGKGKEPCPVCGSGKSGDTWHHLTLVELPKGMLVLRFSCAAIASKRLEGDFDRTAKSVRRLAPSSKVLSKNEGLPPGWAVLRTEHYDIHHNLTEREAKPLGQKFEAILRKYRELLPDRNPSRIPARYRVRLFETRTEFQAYWELNGIGSGSAPGGFFSPTLGELACYTRDELHQPVPVESVIYHEAMHQYLDEILGQRVAFPIWLDEGMGEYFGAAEMTSGADLRIGPDWQHLNTAKLLVQNRDYMPLEEFLALDHASFMDRASLHYAQAWSLVYFFFHPPDRLYQGILERFIERAQATANAWAAFQETFGRLDLKKLEGHWVEYVRNFRIGAAKVYRK